MNLEQIVIVELVHIKNVLWKTQLRSSIPTQPELVLSNRSHVYTERLHDRALSPILVMITIHGMLGFVLHHVIG